MPLMDPRKSRTPPAPAHSVSASLTQTMHSGSLLYPTLTPAPPAGADALYNSKDTVGKTDGYQFWLVVNAALTAVCLL